MRKADFLRNEDQRRSIDSIENLVPGKFYNMEYFADYCLDEAIADNPATLEEFNAFAAKYLLNLPTEEKPLESIGAGCSVFAGHNREGEQLLARNYDYSHEITAMMMPQIAGTAISSGDESPMTPTMIKPMARPTIKPKSAPIALILV